MKLLLFSGSHPRHLFVNQKVLEFFDEVMVIIMQREALIPEPPSDLSFEDRELFIKHFANRSKVEIEAYGNLEVKDIYKNTKNIFVSDKELNTLKIANEIKEFNADFAFIFGVNLILDPVINVLPENKINLHLGLSPWYKGSATLYFPFYNLRPQYCGSTFHQITRKADAGEIIHQCVPVLNYGDKIHDVGAKCVLKAKEDLSPLIKHWLKEGNFDGEKQLVTGKNWLGSDFHASQLRVIYKLFDDDIVDAYLNGHLEQRQPKLVSCL